MFTRGKSRIWALSTVAAIAISSSAFAEDAKKFDISPQRLTTALEAFGQQANVEILFDGKQLDGKMSPGLKGDFTPPDALKRLIQGAGVRFNQPNPTTFVVSLDSGKVPSNAAAVTVPGAVYGQQAQSQADSTVVVVTGIRGSLRNAIAVKRKADVIEDVISAEDMGKFPDQNIAESLQRVTGIQITRNQGEGQNVTVRGLDPRFSRVTYNGRNLPSATGSRSFDFTILSSDFINVLKVLKTPSADMSEGGLAATVDVETLNPLSVRGRKLSFTSEAIYDENSGSTTPHFAGVYAEKFLNGTLGVTLGADYSKRKLAISAYQAFGFEPATEAGKNFDVNGDGDKLDSFAFNHAANYTLNLGNRERVSMMGNVHYRPNDVFEGRVDYLYSKFTNDTFLPLNSNRFTNISSNGGYVATVVDTNNNLTVLDANGVDNRNNARTSLEVAELNSGAVGGLWHLGKWTVDAEASMATSKRLSSDFSLEVIGRSNAVEDLRADPSKVASITYVRGYDPLNPHNFNAIGFNGSLEVPTVDKANAAYLKATYDADYGWIKTVEGGINYDDRRHSSGSRRISVSAQKIATELNLPYDPVLEGGSFNAAAFMSTFGSSKFLDNYDGPAKYITTWLSADPKAFMKTLPLSRLLALSPPTQDLTSVAGIEEKSTSAYFKANFASPNGDISGNFGVRVVQTDQTSTGYAPDYGNIIFDQGGAVTIVPDVTLAKVSRSYTESLPSFNLKYTPSNELTLRFALARVMTRPDLSILSPATTINANVKSISTGNPNVKPYLANQLDVSAEWYPDKDTLFSAALFVKDIDSFIVSSQHTQTLTVKNLQGGGTTNIDFTVNQPSNGLGAKLRGVELGLQQPFSFLPSPFDGFGIIANYTYIDADKIAFVAGGPKSALPGVSRNNYNLVGYYEKGPIGIRVSYNYRDKYVVNSLSYFGDGDFVKAYGQLDLSASYNINSNVVISLDALNLTNTPVNNVNKYNFSRGYEDDGRRITAGIHLKY